MKGLAASSVPLLLLFLAPLIFVGATGRRAHASAGKIPPDSLRARFAGERPDSLGSDSLRVVREAPKTPPRIVPAGQPAALIRMDDESLRRATEQDLRDLIRSGLHLGVLDAGSPNLPEPLDTGVPGRDLPELRLDGFPVTTAGWPETPPVPASTITLDGIALRRMAPIEAPLSSTGGMILDARSAPVPNDRAVSTVRLTRGSYETYSEEVGLRRAIGPFLLSGSFGDTRTLGRGPWERQKSETTFLRVGHALAGGFMQWGLDDAFQRFRLLSTKRGLYDRSVWGARWQMSDSIGRGAEAGVAYTVSRGGWATSRGLTERRTRAAIVKGLLHRRWRGDLVSLSLESEHARTRFHRFDDIAQITKDLSIGLAAGWTRERTLTISRASAGIVRLAPLGVSPVFAVEHETHRAGWPRIEMNASRSVRHRTLPRLPTDGEAWVRQGLGLADEAPGETPEALWRAGLTARLGTLPGRAELSIGCDLLWTVGGLTLREEDLPLLGIDRQDDLPGALQRGRRLFVLPRAGLSKGLPLGFRFRAFASGAVAEGGASSHLALPESRGDGELGWNGALFKGDLRLDLSVQAWGRGRIVTPYGFLPGTGQLDGTVRAGVGAADLFFVLANLSDQTAASLSYESGRFWPLPRRHYRMGFTWRFVD